MSKEAYIHGFEILQLNNPTREGLHRIYEKYLKDGYSIRFVYKGIPVPNIELKMAFNYIHKYALQNSLEVLIYDKQVLHISPLELQIAYKLGLGSEKILAMQCSCIISQGSGLTLMN